MIRRFRSLLAAGALALPAALPAQQVPALRHEKYTLDNGLEVILHQDRSVPLVSVEMLYKVGSADEQKGRTGFAHLFEHIMFMGSQNVPVGAFDQWLEAAGANNNGSTNNDRTNYYEWMPSNALPLALWLEADRMGRLLPTMDQAKLDLQRDVVKNERRQGVDNVPYGRASETILTALYPASHPYSWPVIGSLADLSAASLDDVKGFFRTYYAPNNASLVIAGDFEPDSAKAWVARYFAGIPRGPALPPRPTPPQVTVAKDTFLVMEDRVQLPRVFWTWPTVKVFHQNDAALDLLAGVVAGDKNSRLYKRLVYDMQIAQSVNANHFSGKLDGYFRVDVTPRPGQQPQRIAELVREELERIAAQGVEPRELDRVRNSYLARFLDNLASVQSKASQLGYYNYIVGDPDYAQEDAARYQAVTAADIQRVAREYLGKPKIVLTVVPQGKKELAVQGNVP
ncbi:MAG TPA: pitrilysin family protein [Gemmatimonadaceae bacterium]|nr:pitrilysin family protein [Gemmatimonadaceae bacterium]